MGDILDLGLPDAPEGAWAPIFQTQALQDPFPDLTGLEAPAEASLRDESLPPGFEAKQANGKIHMGRRTGKAGDSDPREDDEPISDSDEDPIGKGRKVCSASLLVCLLLR